MARVLGLGHVGIYVRDLERWSPSTGISRHADHQAELARRRRVPERRPRGRRPRDRAHAGPARRQGSPSHPADLHAGRQPRRPPGVPTAARRRGYRIEGVVNHASAIGCYFFDPEGNRTEVFWVTGRPCWVPTGTPSTSSSPTRRCWPRWTASGTSCATCRSAGGWTDETATLQVGGSGVGCAGTGPGAAGRRPAGGLRAIHGVPDKEKAMALTLDRRKFLVGTALAAALPRRPGPGQAGPHRPAHREDRAARPGGIQMEQGMIRFLKDRNYTLAGRKAELVVGDTGGNPAGTKIEDAGAGRARQRRHDLRAARRLRAPRHHRLRRAGEDADPEPRRRRGHDAAAAQPLLRPRLRHVGPEHVPASPTTRPRS